MFGVCIFGCMLPCTWGRTAKVAVSAFEKGVFANPSLTLGGSECCGNKGVLPGLGTGGAAAHFVSSELPCDGVEGIAIPS